MVNVNSQDMPNYTQYVNNNTFFNPSASSMVEKMCVNLVHRAQWVSFPGQPTVTALAFSNYFSSYNMGLGINIQRDAIGNFDKYSFGINYSYKFKISKRINMGMGIGGDFQNSYLTNANWNTNNNNKDKAIPYDKGDNWNTAINLGIFIQSIKWSFSLTTLSLVKFDKKNSSALSPKIYFTSHYEFDLNKKVSILPFIDLKSDISSFQFDIGAGARVLDRFVTGVSYRFQDSFNFFLGYDFKEGFAVAYSYDMNISNINYYSKGSHELSIKYCFDIYDSLGLGESQEYEKVRNVRFL